jgi:hypothetical protein
MNADDQVARSPGALSQSGARPRGISMWGPVLLLVLAGLSAFLVAVFLEEVHVDGAGQFARAGYCSVPGNTAADGSALQPGTFLDLVVGEPSTNGHYAGSAPANFVKGAGLTCGSPPPGYTRQGFASDAEHVGTGIYPYYAPADP